MKQNSCGQGLSDTENWRQGRVQRKMSSGETSQPEMTVFHPVGSKHSMYIFWHLPICNMLCVSTSAHIISNENNPVSKPRPNPMTPHTKDWCYEASLSWHHLGEIHAFCRTSVILWDSKTYGLEVPGWLSQYNMWLLILGSWVQVPHWVYRLL